MGLVLLVVCFSLAMYCIVYLEWYKGIKHYDQEYPAIPPITTAAFIAASCRWNIYINKISVKSFIFSYKCNKKENCFRHQKSRMNLFLCFSCSLNIALWPVWSIFTPLILFTQFMGLVMFNTLMGWMWEKRYELLVLINCLFFLSGWIMLRYDCAPQMWLLILKCLWTFSFLHVIVISGQIEWKATY